MVSLAMENEMNINGKILRIFNQDPSVWVNEDGLRNFTRQLCEEIKTSGKTLEKLFKLETIAQTENKVEIKGMFDDEVTLVHHDTLKKLISRVQQQMLFLITSLMLCIEQVLFNDFNPNLKSMMRILNQDMNKLSQRLSFQLDKQVKSKSAEIGMVEIRGLLGIVHTRMFVEKLNHLPGEELHDVVTELLSHLIMTDARLSQEFRITFLQLMSLLVETNVVLDNQKLDNQLIEALETYLKTLLIQIADGAEMSPLEGNMALILIAQVMSIGEEDIVERIFDTKE